MAFCLARASAQIQGYIDFPHQYNRLPARSLKRFADPRAQPRRQTATPGGF